MKPSQIQQMISEEEKLRVANRFLTFSFETNYDGKPFDFDTNISCEHVVKLVCKQSYPDKTGYAIRAIENSSRNIHSQLYGELLSDLTQLRHNIDMCDQVESLSLINRIINKYQD